MQAAPNYFHLCVIWDWEFGVAQPTRMCLGAMTQHQRLDTFFGPASKVGQHQVVVRI